MLKNGHKFVREGKDKDPREQHGANAIGGDYCCCLCGAWTTYCLSQEKADEKMGICPIGSKYNEDGEPTVEVIRNSEELSARIEFGED